MILIKKMIRKIHIYTLTLPKTRSILKNFEILANDRSLLSTLMLPSSLFNARQTKFN